jgi:hypothetical protein
MRVPPSTKWSIRAGRPVALTLKQMVGPSSGQGVPAGTDAVAYAAIDRSIRSIVRTGLLPDAIGGASWMHDRRSPHDRRNPDP